MSDRLADAQRHAHQQGGHGAEDEDHESLPGPGGGSEEPAPA